MGSEILEITAIPSTSQRPVGGRPQQRPPTSHTQTIGMYSTTEAIANFKPSPREVISGIAPHVFDERKRRRSQKRAPRPYWYTRAGEKRPSPLRGAAVIMLDDHSIYLEQPDLQRSTSTMTTRSDDGTRLSASNPSPSSNAIVSRSIKAMNFKSLRVDKQLFKTLRLKLVTSLYLSNKQS